MLTTPQIVMTALAVIVLCVIGMLICDHMRRGMPAAEAIDRALSPVVAGLLYVLAFVLIVCMLAACGVGHAPA